MGMWIAILVLVLTAVGAGIFYMIHSISRFGLIKKLAKEKPWPKRIISLGLIVLGFGVFSIILTPINAIIIFLHLCIFWLIYGGIFLAIKKLAGKEFKIYLQGWFALATTTVYMSIAYYLCVNVWVTNYTLTTEKDLGGKLHVVMFADSHVGATFDGEGFAKHMERVNAEKPDIVLIAGDYVDDGTTKEEMIRSCKALGQIDAKYGVWFAYGNHDKGYYGSSRGFSAEELEAELEKNGVHILVDETELIDDRFYLVGRADKSFEDRASASELIKDLDDSKYIIVMDHQPADYAAEAKTNADLVLSGHTHGGQLFPMTHFGLFMSINDRTYGYENRNGTNFLVTSGIADWELVFKTGTKSEYCVIDIEEK